MVTVAGHGLVVDVLRGWEARMWKPALPPPAINLPVIRVANVPLKASHDTYGGETADTLTPGRVVASLVEFDSSLADVGLYGPQGLPLPIEAEDLDPRAVQRQRTGRAGLQRFFSIDGRAFSLYVVARDGAALGRSLRELSLILGTLVVRGEAPR